MLEREHPDICATRRSRGIIPRIAVDCLEAGAHVICEKPMALSTADADARSPPQEAAHVSSPCAFRTFQCAGTKGEAALEAGRLGRVLHGMIQVRWNRDAGY